MTLLSLLSMKGAFPLHADDGQMNQQKWQRLTEAQKNEVRDHYREFQKLPATEKQVLVSKFEKFRAMSPQDQNRIRRNYERYKKMPAAEKKRLVSHPRGTPNTPVINALPKKRLRRHR